MLLRTAHAETNGRYGGIRCRISASRINRDACRLDLEQRRAGASKTDITVSPAGDPVNADYQKRNMVTPECKGTETQEAERSARFRPLRHEGEQMADPKLIPVSGADAVLVLRRALALPLGVADPAGIDSMETFNAQAKAAALDVMGGSLGTPGSQR